MVQPLFFQEAKGMEGQKSPRVCRARLECWSNDVSKRMTSEASMEITRRAVSHAFNTGIAGAICHEPFGPSHVSWSC
jgi:hypothetical protein